MPSTCPTVHLWLKSRSRAIVSVLLPPHAPKDAHMTKVQHARRAEGTALGHTLWESEPRGEGELQLFSGQVQGRVVRVPAFICCVVVQWQHYCSTTAWGDQLCHQSRSGTHSDACCGGYLLIQLPYCTMLPGSWVCPACRDKEAFKSVQGHREVGCPTQTRARGGEDGHGPCD